MDPSVHVKGVMNSNDYWACKWGVMKLILNTQNDSRYCWLFCMMPAGQQKANLIGTLPAKDVALLVLAHLPAITVTS